jgi:hypothetical protein
MALRARGYRKVRIPAITLIMRIVRIALVMRVYAA